MPTALRLRSLLAVIVLCFLTTVSAFAQTETATLSGVIQDPRGALVPDVEVTATRIETGTTVTTRTNGAGIYFFTGLVPGHYHVMVRKPGFKEIAIKGFELNVQDKLEQNFSLEIGSVSESVTVNATDVHINTTDATVSTLIDRNFAENLPMNGRSFQTLIQLTPGVVLTTSSNNGDEGQFSVNGQRAASNYWMVDGVSANVGIGVSSSNGSNNGIAGALGSFSAQGGTNSLVSVDAMQEFRIQTSTFAPEFGRTPGAQISIVTRSGTNPFHGTVFDYFRNDALDANDWFADANGLPKPEERQNDFGGVLGGPILKDKTFFFFSYEGLRLRLPQVALTQVPDITARQNAIPAMQPYLNAFPLPNGADNLVTGLAQFNASYSNSSTLNAYSLRIDHKVNSNLSLFGRYNYSPSEVVERGNGDSLSTVSPSRITIQTGTAAATWSASPLIVNDFRFNYSRANAFSSLNLDNFGGAVPLVSLPLPPGFTSQNALFSFGIFSGASAGYADGINGGRIQHQINLIDNLSFQKASHSLKFGVDFRRLSPSAQTRLYTQLPRFLTVSSAETGNLFFYETQSGLNASLLLRNLGVFAQDTWRATRRLTLTYGLRWDVDFSPSTLSGPKLQAITGFNVNNLSNLALAPVGTPAFETQYGNFAPRLGLAYQLSQSRNWQTVVRGGFGVFYDLATTEVGNISVNGFGEYPFGATAFSCCNKGTFPLDAAAAASPPITAASLSSGILFALDPHLKLPYTLQWNVALEQGLGAQQTVTASYVGAAGRRLIQTLDVNSPTPSLGEARLVTNSASSNYNALQLQFQRRLSRGLQALASYTWSHSIDDASAGSEFGNLANALVPGISPNANRADSDFDIRHAFTAGVTYDIPSPKTTFLLNALSRGWSVDTIVQVRSAQPVNIYDSVFFNLQNAATEVRPDLVPGQPLYLFGSHYPGGKIFNAAAFAPPPADSNGNPLRQGNLRRNALKGFGATQWDFAVHRDFVIRESLKLQFRAEMFNVLNHPNFGTPVADISNTTQFGQSTQMLGQSLNQNATSGGFNPLYQIGGPRSIQFALKLMF